MKRYYILLLLVFCVMGLSLSIVFELFYIGHPVRDNHVHAPISTILAPVETIALGWVNAIDADSELLSTWEQGLSEKSRESGVSLYLYRADTLCLWINHAYRAEVDSIDNNLLSSICFLDGNKVLVRSFRSGDRRAVVVLNLIDEDGDVNRSIFSSADVRLFPTDDLVAGENVETIDLTWSSFKMAMPIAVKSPFWVNTIGWLALFAGVFAFKRVMRRGTTVDNALQRLSLFFLVMLFVRALTYFVDVPHGGSFSFLSLDSLVVTQLLILVVVQHAYQLRYKIRQQIESLSKAKRYVLLVIFTAFINACVVYFQYAIVQIIYTNSTSIELYNVLAIEPYTLFFYSICAIFVAMRVLYGRFFAITLGGFPIWIRIALSVTIMVAMVTPIERHIGNTGYLLICFHIIFLVVSYLSRKRDDGRVFFYDIIVFTSYITLFFAIEAASTKSIEAERYAAELSTRQIVEGEMPLLQNARSGMTYSILSTDEVMLKAGHKLDVQNLLPYINIEHDTLVMMKGFVHNIKRSRLNDAVVAVSYQRTSVMDAVSLFAYLFIWLFVVSGIMLLLSPMLIFRHYNPRSMLYRVRAVIFSVVLISMLAVAFVVYRYSISTYRTQQRELLNTSAQSLLNSFNLYCQSYPKQDVMRKWYAGLGSSQGAIVNLYDLSARRIDGSVEYFSSSRLFDMAYRHLVVDGLPYFSYADISYTGRYTSVYVPLSWQTERVGYMSVVLIDQEDMMTRYSLLGNILNVFVVLFLFAIIISMGLYAIIAKPLGALYDGLSGIGQMRKIPFRENVKLNDEVGALIVQYNKMIDYLHESYAALARSEREGAWREMARQVAHEIKNPLTPMRLKIQMLQRARADGNDNVYHQLDSTLTVLLEQIDILTKITTEFSNLARMPQGASVRLELSGLLRNTVGLYTNNSNGVEVSYQPPSHGGVFVNVEYAGFTQVIVNLLQNATQALGCYGNIVVRLSTDGNSAIVEVQDDGCGIEEELLDRIFEPNFTTKSSGSGLGLAIARQIIENSGGTISAKNREDSSGAIFTIILPLCS